MRITYVGHATVLIEHVGMRLLTDPVLRDRVGPLRRHGPTPAESISQGLDAALISHLHGDHLDRPSMRAISGGPTVIAPLGSAPLIRRDGHHRVREVSVGELVDLQPTARQDSDRPDAIRVKATDALHAGRRPPFGPTTPTVGFEISGAGRRIYFAGDTGYFPGMADLGGGPDQRLDLALLPIWGWGPTLGAGHLDPETAARATALLRPRIVVPIHWGTFFPIGLGRWSPRHLREPPRLFADYVSEYSPETEVRVLEPGESLILP